MSENKTPIPIQNLFYMLCYAWNVLAIADNIKVGIDDFNDAYNLLSRVFTFGIGKLIRSGFHRSYIEKTEELHTMKGRILIKESIGGLSTQRKKLVCSFDEYSTNDIFNQILKYTIDSLINNPSISTVIKKDLKKQSVFFAGIDSKAPTKECRQKLIFNRNNITYKLLINIAIMLYDNTIVNEDDGKSIFKDFYRQEQMHKVFELFILNFYSLHLDKKNYKVHAPKINWHLEENVEDVWGDLFDIDTDLGNRRTDIVIENKEMNLQLIFDAKYYQSTFVEAYMNQNDTRIRASHLNQLRGYLLDSDYAGKKIGALLYPMVDDDLNRGVLMPIEGASIFVKTINLNDEWKNIEEDLLNFLGRVEEGFSRSQN